MPAMPVAAALSAAHLAALVLPPTLRRLYVARDNDAAGRFALERLRARPGTCDFEFSGLPPGPGASNAAPHNVVRITVVREKRLPTGGDLGGRCPYQLKLIE